MLVGFYSGRMVTVFPIGPFPVFPLVELLPDSSRYQLYRPWDDIPVATVSE